jgi:hypothetical protein
MRADNDGGLHFYSHLRDAYDAFEAGNRAEGHRSMMAAAAIDADALLAADWWTSVRAGRETALTPTSDSDLSTIATAFDTSAAINSSVAVPVAEKASSRVVHPVIGAWLKRVSYRVRFSLAAASFSTCALLVASVQHSPSHARSSGAVVTAPNRIGPAASRTVRRLHYSSRSLVSPNVTRATADDPEPIGKGRRWLSPRLEQLGVLPTWRAAVIGLEDRRLLSELQQSVGELWVGRTARGEHDAIIIGMSDASGLARLSALELSLKVDGLIWVLHPANDVTMTTEILTEAARDAHLRHLASMQLTPTLIAEKFSRPRNAQVSQADSDPVTGALFDTTHHGRAQHGSEGPFALRFRTSLDASVAVGRT